MDVEATLVTGGPGVVDRQSLGSMVETMVRVRKAQVRTQHDQEGDKECEDGDENKDVTGLGLEEGRHVREVHVEKVECHKDCNRTKE